MHSSPPSPTPKPPHNHPGVLDQVLEVVPDSQSGIIPEYYTSPIPVPADSQFGTVPEGYTSPIPIPEFTLIEPNYLLQLSPAR